MHEKEQAVVVGDWYYSPDYGQLCQVIEAQTLWDQTICRVWLPGKCRAEL